MVFIWGCIGVQMQIRIKMSAVDKIADNIVDTKILTRCRVTYFISLILFYISASLLMLALFILYF